MLSEGGRIIMAGVVIGGVVAAAIGRALETPLFDVSAADGISIGASAIGFGVIALSACLLPALQAARMDLLSALHQE